MIKEKVNIKNMAVWIMKFEKGTNGKMILECENGQDLKTLRTSLQTTATAWVRSFMITKLPQKNGRWK